MFDIRASTGNEASQLAGLFLWLERKMNDTKKCSATPLMDVIPQEEAKPQEHGDKVAKENSAAVEELAAGKLQKLA